MSYLIGSSLALLTVILLKLARLNRYKVFYPLLLVVIASYYVLFALLGKDWHALFIEIGVMLLFSIVAIVAYFKNPLWIVLGLLAHGLFDYLHPYLWSNSGLPNWWPQFCMSYDVVLAGAILLSKKREQEKYNQNDPQGFMRNID